jgi:hypothetical protein
VCIVVVGGESDARYSVGVVSFDNQ